MPNREQSAGSNSGPRDRIDLLLAAEGFEGLLPLLREPLGSRVARRYRLDAVLAIGRQSFVFTGTDLSASESVVLKQPAFDYRNPIHYDRATIAWARAALRTEYEVLLSVTTSHLPRPIEMLTIDSPIPAAKESPELATNEVLVVQEYIHGRTVRELALEVWPDVSPHDREESVRGIARSFVEFWEGLHAAGWHYGDISAENLLLEDSGGRLRVVDAGSAVRAGDHVLLPGYTPAFLTPKIFQAVSYGQPLPGNLASVLPPLAKLLHFALTGEQPWNGLSPDLGSLSQFSRKCRAAIDALLQLDETPQRLTQARSILMEWVS